MGQRPTLDTIACCAPLGSSTLSDDEAEATAALFKALGDPARVRIVNLLAGAGGEVCVCELTRALELAQPTVSHHLKKLHDAGLLDRERRGKWAIYSLSTVAVRKLATVTDLKEGVADAVLLRVLRLRLLQEVNVLFVCIGNQGRSVLAERLFRSAAGPDHQARSAGAAPGDATHPEVLEVLRELGIDASGHVPRKLDEPLLDWADVVVATCDGSCPLTPGKRRLDWQIPDPIGRPLTEVRALRDEIRTRVDALLAELRDL